MPPISKAPTLVALGGAGGMGRTAVRVAAEWEDLGELVVADLDPGAAERFVAELRPSTKAKLTAVAVDVTDEAALGALLSRADVVLNTTGPFYRLGVPILRAAIDAGCAYLDICDDWEPTIDMLTLHERAARRGVLAVIGIGASPGLSNLLAVMACRRLDTVDDLYTAWPVDVELEGQSPEVEPEGFGGTSAALIHWMQQISGEIQVVERGELVSRPPLAPIALDFPGTGKGTGYTVGHPEPITLRTRMGVRGQSANLMVLKASTAAFLQSLGADIDARKISLEEAAKEIAHPGVVRSTKALARGLTLEGPGALPPFFAYARGEKDGRPATSGAFVLALPPGMDGVTGIPLALAARQLLDGKLVATGVHPPETVIEPEPFFEAVAPYCQPPRSGLESILEVTMA